MISAFSATPAAVAAATPTSVLWSWAFATTPSPAPSCTIDQGVGAVASGGATRVTLSADTTYELTCTNAAGSATRTTTVALGAPPLQPSAIAANDSPCQGATGLTYSVTPVPDVTYTWSFDGTGAIIASGEGSHSITVAYVASATSGTWIVTPSNAFGDGPEQTLPVALRALPEQPSVITGSASLCQGASGLSYSVTNVTGVGYAWAYTGTGATISAGQGTPSITVDYSGSATSGSWLATLSNSCGFGASSSLGIVVGAIPAQPSVITGDGAACLGSSQGYSVTDVAGVSYAWSFPLGWNQTGGTTTHAVTVTVGAGAGDIQVTPSSSCGTGTPITFAVAPATVPSQPSSITGNVTPDRGASQTYSVTGVGGVSYAWSLPADWNQTTGGTSNSVTVTVGTSSGTIQVTPSTLCGDGTARTLAVTVPDSLVQIAAGFSHTCALTGSGKVFCWGSDSAGQLGDDATLADKATATAVNTTNLSADDKIFVQITAGGSHTCGLTGKGKAFCWGWDGNGELGDNVSLANKAVPTAVDTTGLAADDKAFVQIRAGLAHTCALSGKGKAFCWGYDGYGQLGDGGTNTDMPIPSAVDTTGLAADDKAFAQLTGGGSHTCGLSGKGKAFCWGYDGYGQLGDSVAHADRGIPTAVDATGLAADDKAFAQLVAGDSHTCGITGRGKAYCWGYDSTGQLGDGGTNTDMPIMIAVDTTGLAADDKAFVRLAAGASHTCALTTQGKALCWGDDSYGQLGDDAILTGKSIPTAVDASGLAVDDKAFVQLASGQRHTCALSAAGKAYCWGRDDYGQLGDDANLVDKALPTAVQRTGLAVVTPALVQIAAAQYHTCGLTGKGKAFCWGWDNNGQLGDDAALADQPIPAAVDTTGLAADDKAFVQLATGTYHSCGITGKGKAFCWGNDDFGQLGDDTMPAGKPTPTAVDTGALAADDKAFVQITAGYQHTCGLTGAGKAYCWGRDDYGQLGDGATLLEKRVPTAVDATGLAADDKAFVQLAAGYYHTCGLTGAGKAFCWGRDDFGQLGDDAILAGKPVPSAVDTTGLAGDDKAFAQLSATGANTCGITAQGKAFCWGDDGFGQLGNDAPLVDKPIPTVVDMAGLAADDKAFVQIAAGSYHTCAITGFGQPYCWGRDDNGQLGDDVPAVSMPLPTAVDTSVLQGGDKAMAQITAGGFHSCAITAAGKAFCWGYDGFGALGNDATHVGKPTASAVDMTGL